MKKTVSFLLALMLLLAFTACGAAEPESTETTGTDTEATAEAASEATEPTASEAQKLYDLGMEALEAGDTDAAYEHFEAARANDETSPFGWLGLSELRIRDYDFEGAEALLTEALEKTGNNPAVAKKLEMLRGSAIFDSSGKRLKTTGYDENGVIVYYQITTYRPDGREDTISSYNAGGEQTGFVQLEYGEKGRPIVSYFIESDTGMVGRIEYVYDEAGNPVEEYHYSPDGYLRDAFVCEFDEAGQKIREEQYNGEYLANIYYYYYDAGGWLEREDTCNAYDELEIYMLYIRDEAGRLTENRCYYSNGLLFWRMERTYGEDGQVLTEAYYDADGNLTHVDEYE